MKNEKALIAVFDNLQIAEDAIEKRSNKEQFELLVQFIDDLIRNDFNRLVRILYRVDISEQKLNDKLIQANELNSPSAEVIAKLLIERENEKIISRAKHSNK